MDADGKPSRRREDIQVCDASPTLLIEVKGINALPREADSLQVTKYLVPRMKEWARTDVQGVSIVNHQRKVPALDRKNGAVFQDDVLVNAEQQSFGLLTTWDLFRLVRGFLRNGWTHQHVRGLFYRSGRIVPIPSHYEYIGVVDGYWEKAHALGVRLERGTLRVGDTVAYDAAVDFVEHSVSSMQLDDEQVREGLAGDHVGVETALDKHVAKDGIAVYRIPGSPGNSEEHTA